MLTLQLQSGVSLPAYQTHSCSLYGISQEQNKLESGAFQKNHCFSMCALFHGYELAVTLVRCFESGRGNLPFYSNVSVRALHGARARHAGFVEPFAESAGLGAARVLVCPSALFCAKQTTSDGGSRWTRATNTLPEKTPSQRNLQRAIVTSALPALEHHLVLHKKKTNK